MKVTGATLLRLGLARFAALLCVLLLMAAPTRAHYLDIVQFTLVEQANPNVHQLVVTMPANLDANAPLIVPRHCVLMQRDSVTEGQSHIVSMMIDCDPELAEQAGTELTGQIETRWGRDGGMLQLQMLDGSSASVMLSGNRTGISLDMPVWDELAAQPPQGFLEKAWRYLELGTVHVLIGWDHLAFVFCLAMLATGLPLIGLITSFTVGHSLSLALAHLGLVNIPIAPVEAVIALSVVFMAREVFFTPGSRLSLRRAQNPEAFPESQAQVHSHRWRMGVTAAFGLIHGLGFASVLGELGVSAADTVIALAFFNIGVEAGQVLFVGAILLALAILRRLGRVEYALMHATTCLVGGMGVFWTLQRVVG